MARARKFWIGIDSADHVEEAWTRSFCLLVHCTDAAMAAMHPGDGLALFARLATEHSKDRVERFEAIGVIGPGTAWTRGRDGGVIRRLQARWRPQARPASGEALASKLDFVKDPARWRRSFARDRARIEREDFARIAEAMQLPGFAWEIRNDRGFAFTQGPDDIGAIADAHALRRRGAARDRERQEGPFRMRRT